MPGIGGAPKTLPSDASPRLAHYRCSLVGAETLVGAEAHAELVFDRLDMIVGGGFYVARNQDDIEDLRAAAP